MKIGILTFHAVPNFGAALQALALQSFLQSEGHEPFIIDYRPAYLTTGGPFRFPKSKEDLRANLIKAYQKVNTLRVYTNSAKKQQLHLFSEFHQSHLNLSKTSYRTIDELRKNPPKADAYICGSDQIWNPPVQHGVDPACFLDFGPNTVPKFSYSASFGSATIDQRFLPDIETLVKNLDAVSVREQSGTAILDQISTQPVEVVPDPTFLCDWDKIQKPRVSSDSETVFSYFLRSGEGVYDFQKNLSDQSGLTVLEPVNLLQRWKSYSKKTPIAPLGFLAEMKKARWVITNSFHGTVFAILLRKPFLTATLPGKRGKLNERMTHLLSTLGLLDRQISITEPTSSVLNLLEREIDWPEIEKRQKSLSEEGKSYLRQNLKLS
ncbi:MAG: polysaccharide pyruvyl transferase family protein [Opitutales bacterium]|nr:polysaccharide pyruvyl transferase family protein [Opitutales bacterium]